MSQMIDTHEVTIRLAGSDDERAVIRLAQRDSGWPPPSPLLLGFAGERLVAAVSLADGRVIADPFERTGAVVEMLRTRAGQLSAAARPGRLARLRIRRRRPRRLAPQTPGGLIRPRALDGGIGRRAA